MQMLPPRFPLGTSPLLAVLFFFFHCELVLIRLWWNLALMMRKPVSTLPPLLPVNSFKQGLRFLFWQFVYLYDQKPLSLERGRQGVFSPVSPFPRFARSLQRGFVLHLRLLRRESIPFPPSPPPPFESTTIFSSKGAEIPGPTNHPPTHPFPLFFPLSCCRSSPLFGSTFDAPGPQMNFFPALHYTPLPVS